MQILFYGFIIVSRIQRNIFNVVLCCKINVVFIEIEIQMTRTRRHGYPLQNTIMPPLPGAFAGFNPRRVGKLLGFGQLKDQFIIQ